MEKEEKLVETVDGTKAVREDCRYIKGNYYLIGDPKVKGSGQCYLVDGKYCRDETNYIEYDHGLSKYVRNNEKLVHGIVDINEEDLETPIYGYFSKNLIYNVEVTLKNGNRKICLNENILKNTYYRERINDGTFWHIHLLSAYAFNNKNHNNDIKFSLPYNSKDVLEDNILSYNKFNDSEPTDKIKKISSYIEDFTYGLEFETSIGFIPDRIRKRLGLIALRDGSIEGLEYVTIPLSGDKGLQTIIDSCKELDKRTEIDFNCSLHLHIGGVPRTMKFITAFYKLLCYVEDDFYSLFPLYKKQNFGVKKKSYTKPLPVLDVLTKMDYTITDKNLLDNFDILFNYFSMGQDFKHNFNSLDDVESHPSDPNGQSKWYIKSRYHGVNFIPLIFGNKKTIEFRLHTPTFNHNKIINFILICSALLKYTKAYQDNILNNTISLHHLRIDQICNNIYRHSNFNANLNDYIHHRKNSIKNQLVVDGNIKSDESQIMSFTKWDKEPKQQKSFYDLEHLKQTYQQYNMDANQLANHLNEIAQPVQDIDEDFELEEEQDEW